MAKLEKQMLIILIALALATASCSTTHWVLSNLCLLTGGTWVDIPTDPNGGFCSRARTNAPEINTEDTQNNKPGQDPEVLISDPLEADPNTGEEENSAGAGQQNEAAPGENPSVTPLATTTSIYKGSTSIASTWVDTWGGQVIMDEITIHIDSNGNVSGAILSIWESGRSDPIEWEDGSCVTEGTRTVTADLSGSLAEQNDTIQLAFTHVYEIQRYGCPSGNETLSDTWTSEAQLIISGTKINGSTPEGFTFEALQQ